MPRDVLGQLEEAKQSLDSNDQTLAISLDNIIEKARESSESMSVLQGIVSALTEGGRDLSKSLDKVVFYFEKFEDRINKAKQSALGLGKAYLKLGKDTPTQLNKISNSLEEVYKKQKEYSKNCSYKTTAYK